MYKSAVIRWLGGAAAVAMTASGAFAQGLDSTSIAGLKWRNVGPATFEGRLSDVVGIPGPSKTIFVAAAAGGIWKSTNAGLTWRPVFDDKRIISMGMLAIAPSEIAFSLLVLLAAPMLVGIAVAHRAPAFAARLRRPLARASLVALFAFIVVGLYRDRALLDSSLLPLLAIVIAQNGAGLSLGDLCARAFRLPPRARRAIVIEAGMQNSGLALGIIALQFGGDLGMVVIASLWGIWHIVTGLGLAFLWRRHDVRHGL